MRQAPIVRPLNYTCDGADHFHESVRGRSMTDCFLRSRILNTSLSCRRPSTSRFNLVSHGLRPRLHHAFRHRPPYNNFACPCGYHRHQSVLPISHVGARSPSLQPPNACLPHHEMSMLPTPEPRRSAELTNVCWSRSSGMSTLRPQPLCELECPALCRRPWRTPIRSRGSGVCHYD